ncbi:MAG: hypothetical protein COW84_01195 [Gammaproteobacteria bacterium CG22_combo_CG10-13_8_21_14_all_40_8]|nr:MAG: hypothetical protein COW84_01195 [Gammaproteobacteria bacterium CG22_combo_CG10-13_8_21_14_all_40_8]
MTWCNLYIDGVRNLNHLNIDLHNKLTFFTGNNGAGKTSILEAICLLTTGRSFKTRNKISALQHDNEKLHLFAEFKDNQENIHKLGFGMTQSGLNTIKYNGEVLNSLETLSSHYCIKVITPDVFTSITGKVDERRNLLDWQLFHVEQFFLATKKKYTKVLQHRNALLKEAKLNKQPLHEIRKNIQYWNELLISLSEKLDNYRDSTVDTLTFKLNQLLKESNTINNSMLNIYTLSHRYSRGWSKEKRLIDQLTASLQDDIFKGYTQYGAHKFDFTFFINRKSAAETLSRGELKTLAVATQIAQVSIAAQYKNNILVLIDDLFAELDYEHAIWCLQQLWIMPNVQVIVTGIDIHDAVKDKFSAKDTKWFHVEHGKITQR